MADDPQPKPLADAVSICLTALSAKAPPAFVEAAILPDRDGHFPTHDQLLRAFRAEAQRRLTPPAPVVSYDDMCVEWTPTPPPAPPDLTHLRVQTRLAPNGRWVVYVVDFVHDARCYW